MRLLVQGAGMRRLDHRHARRHAQAVSEALGRSAGMVLVTGPTGSGKTTTLYAALAEINADELKGHYGGRPHRIPPARFVASAGQRKIDLTFARVLRAVLRQDPDVVLVGEMRDAETAEIGMRAAITGRLVLSTLHTRDAMSTPFRLLDMGVPPFMVSTSLQAVIAQRLVRMVCKECAAPHTPSAQNNPGSTPCWLLVTPSRPSAAWVARRATAQAMRGVTASTSCWKWTRVGTGSPRSDRLRLCVRRGAICADHHAHHALDLVRQGRRRWPKPAHRLDLEDETEAQD